MLLDNFNKHCYFIIIRLYFTLFYFCLSSLTLYAEIYEGSCGKNVIYKLDTDTGLLKISGNGAIDNKSASYQSGYDKYPLTNAPWKAFYKFISKLEIEEGIDDLGAFCMSGCSELTEAKLPSTIKEISTGTFCGCVKLNSVDLPSTINNIYDDAFKGCLNLTDFEIPDNINKIGNNAFSGCTGLTHINFPESLLSIGNSAFSGCTGLTTINIPSSVTTIGYSAFENCTGLISINIPSSLNNIANSLLKGCSGLVSIDMPNTINTIGYNSFSGCSGLSSITIPNSVKSIGEYAFSGCSSLRSVNIGNSVTTIGNYSFNNCVELNSVIFGNSISDIGYYAFRGCSQLTTVSLPNSVKNIGESAFRNCSSLNNVNIPNSITSIGRSVFVDCPKISEPLFTDNFFIKLPENYTGTYNVPKVLEIVGGAFYNCSTLTSVTIGNSVLRIGESSFSGCSSLTSLTLGNSITNIGDYAFDHCSALTSISIPHSVTHIGNYAFSGCYIKTLYWNAKNCISNMSDLNRLTDLIIGDSVTNIFDINFKLCTKIQNLTIGKNVKAIRTQTFYNCTNLGSVTCYAIEPPYCYPNVFQNKPKSAVLKVYSSCVEKYRDTDQWCEFEIETMPDPRDRTLVELDSLYAEYIEYSFKVGSEVGMYGKEEVEAFYAARIKASEIITSPDDYTDEEIQAALDNLKITYQDVLTSKVDGIVFADATAVTITEEKSYNHFTYIRTFASTNWEELYVPFSIKHEDWEQDYEVAEIYNFHQYDTDNDGKMDITEMEITVLKDGETEPNTPYLIRSKEAGEKTLNMEDVTLQPTVSNTLDCSSTKAKYIFTGTYSNECITHSYILKDGILVKEPEPLIMPQRWYMIISPRETTNLESPAHIRICTTDDYVDGIEETTSFELPQDGNYEIYDILGRKTKNKAGINILRYHNGVVMKMMK